MKKEIGVFVGVCVLFLLWRSEWTSRAAYEVLHVIAKVTMSVAEQAPSANMHEHSFYPVPHDLPPVVDIRTEELLVKLEAVLASKAPELLKHLQPGLAREKILELERQGNFQLSEDLRLFYQWRNGSDNVTSTLDDFQRFLPLQEVLEQKRILSGMLKNSAIATLLEHRQSWVPVLLDPAGDGYFYDPIRHDSQGAFFYHFSEDSSYSWYPSFRNYLACLIELYEQEILPSSDSENLSETKTTIEMRIRTKYSQ